MPNTKPYNKEEVMKEFNDRYVEMSPLHGRDIHNRPPLYDTNLAEVFDMLNFLSTALTLAEQAGEERVREKAVAIIKKNHEEECYPGECSCYLTLEALK